VHVADRLLLWNFVTEIAGVALAGH